MRGIRGKSEGKMIEEGKRDEERVRGERGQRRGEEGYGRLKGKDKGEGEGGGRW